MKVKSNFYLTFQQYCTWLFYLRYFFTVLYDRIITKDPQTERNNNKDPQTERNNNKRSSDYLNVAA